MIYRGDQLRTSKCDQLRTSKGGQLRTSKCPQTLSVCHFRVHWPLIIHTANISLRTLSAAEKEHFSEKITLKEKSWRQSLSPPHQQRQHFESGRSWSLCLLSNSHSLYTLHSIGQMFCGAFHSKCGIVIIIINKCWCWSNDYESNDRTSSSLWKLWHHHHHHPHHDDDYENGWVCDCSG